MIVALTGDIGSGKTLLLTAIAYNDFILEKRVIYSNYKLNFKHIWLNINEINNLFSSNMSFRDKDGSISHKVSFLVDEMHIFLDSRGSGSSLKNKLITYLFTLLAFSYLINILSTAARFFINSIILMSSSSHFFFIFVVSGAI